MCRVGVRELLQQSTEFLFAPFDAFGVIRGKSLIGPSPGEPTDVPGVAAGRRGEKQPGIFQPPNRGLCAFAVFGRNCYVEQSRRTGDRCKGLASENRFRSAARYRGQSFIAVRGAGGDTDEARQGLGPDRLEVGPAGHFGDRTRRIEKSERAARLPLVPVVGRDLDEERLATNPGQPTNDLVAGALGQFEENAGRFEAAHCLLPNSGVGVRASQIGQSLRVVCRVFLDCLEPDGGVAAADRRSESFENGHVQRGARI